MRSVKNKRPHVGAQFALLVGLALGMFGFSAPAQAQTLSPRLGEITSISTFSLDEALGLRFLEPTNSGSQITGYDYRIREFDEFGLNLWTELTSPSGGALTQFTIRGLDNGTIYEVQIRAKHTQGVGPWSDSVSVIPFPPPRNVRVEPGDRRLTVTWEAPPSSPNGNIVAYVVGWKFSNVASYTTRVINNASARSFTITGLTNGREYDVLVAPGHRVAGFGEETGQSSADVKATPGSVPAAPRAPTLTSGDEELAVSWTAPTDTGGSAITDYDVRWRESGTVNWTELDDTSASTDLMVTIPNLTNGTAYQVQVRAQNTEGAGAWSASATATPAGLPDAITDLSANTIAPGPGEVFVDFTLPGRNGADFVRYDVEYRPGTSGSWTRVERLNLSITSIGIPNLVNGQSYQVRVRAVNSVGNAAWSNIIMATPAGPPDAPSAPTLTVGNRQLTVAWQAPASDGGRAIRNYRLRWKRAEASDYSRNNLITIADATVRSRVIPNLVNAQAYDVQVSATNPFPGGWSAATQATPVGPPDAPAVTLSPGDEQIVVSWQIVNDGGRAITGYSVEYKRDNVSVWINAGHSGTDRTLTISSLDNDELYDVRVRATNSLGTSDWSPVAAARVGAPVSVVPAAPMVVMGADAGTLVVTWTAPATHPLAPITDYDIRYKLTSATSWTDLNFTGTGLRAEITGLQDNTQYEVQVRATNLYDGSNPAFPIAVSEAGDWSPSGMETTLTPTAPAAAPSALTVSMNRRAGMLEASWDAIASDRLGRGNLPILNYEVQWKLMSATSWTDAAHSGTGTRTTIRGLDIVSMNYDVRVRAVNRVGASEWAASSGTTFAPAEPSAPRAPTLSSGASGVLSVSWSAPADGGAPITAYEVQWKLASASAETFSSTNVAISGLSATITELEEGEEYDVRVRAQNEVRRLDNGDAVDGWSDWSPVATGSPSSAMRNSRTTSSALSQVGGAVAAGAIDVLGGQLGAASNAASGGAAGGNQSNFTIAGMNLTPDTKARTALPVRTHADEAAPRHSFELSDLLQLGAFRVSLRHDGDEARGESSAGGPSKWAIWGRGNVRGFTAETDTRLELDGEAYAGWLGVDYTHSRSLMGGLAVSYDESRTDYTDPEFGGGEVSTRLGSFYPYLRISPTQALDLWGLMGFGWGSLDFSGEGQEDTSTDMSLQVYALGAQLKLIDLYGAQFSLKSDASFAVLETASQANLPGIRTEPSRMRFALAAQYPWQIDSVSRVTPSVELGGRLDFNEVSGGAGMELGGAVNYNHSTLRLNAEARARGLVYHNDPNVQDWGVSFQLRVDPNQFGQGFFASFAPHWGQSQSRVQRLWRDLDAPQGLAQDMSLQPHQMEAEFGYGFALPRMKATLSPFGRTRFAQTGAQTFSLGSRLQLGDMKLELTGEQQTAPLAPIDHRFSLHLSMPLGK